MDLMEENLRKILEEQEHLKVDQHDWSSDFLHKDFFFLSFFHHSCGFEEQHLADYNELHCLSMTKHIQCRNSLSVFYWENLVAFCFLSPLLSCKLFLLTYVLLFYVTGGHCCSSRVKGELNWKKHYGLWEWNKKHTHKNKQKTPRRFKCKRFKRMLFIWTKRNMQIFRVIPFIKLQNNT